MRHNIACPFFLRQCISLCPCEVIFVQSMYVYVCIYIYIPSITVYTHLIVLCINMHLVDLVKGISAEIKLLLILSNHHYMVQAGSK